MSQFDDDDEIEQWWLQREREGQGMAYERAPMCQYIDCRKAAACRDCGQCAQHCDCDPCCG